MNLILLVVTTAALVAVTPVITRAAGTRSGWILAAVLAACTGWLVVLWAEAPGRQDQASWIPSLDVVFRLQLDGLGLLFGVLVLGVGALVMLYSAAYVTQPRPTSFYTLMVLFAASMLVLVLADDLVVMFVAWELTTLCSYLLILRSGPTAGPPATRTLLVTVAGGLCLLAAVGLIVVHTGTTQLSVALADDAWTDDPKFATATAVLVALAAFTKSAQFPFHAWLPDAMVAPAPVSAYLHAAAMVKAGIYLLLRFAEAASHAPIWPVLLMTIGIVTAIMGAVFALQRTDIKELLAYSTVSQLGLLVATIGVGTEAALLAACLHVVAHALFKASGFMYVGLVERRAGTRDIRELHGLARAMPWTSAMLVLAALSMAGVPPLLGFASKELVLDSALERFWPAALGLALASVFTVAYSARLIVHTLPGAPMRIAPLRGSVSMVLAVASAAVVGGMLGPGVAALDGLVRPAAAAAGSIPVDDVAHLHLWHGVNVALMLSVVVLTLGGVLVLARRRVDGVLGRPLFPGSGVAAVSWLQQAAIDGGRRVGDLTRTDSPAFHLAVPIVLVAGVGLASIGLVGPDDLTVPGSHPVDAILLLLVVVGTAAVIASRTRIGAVIALGIVGLAVALWFYALGAADVALTQLLVEILTVVIIVMVLRHLPRTFRARSSRHRWASGVTAVVAGVTATLATLALTGHREISAAGEYYLREAEKETGGTNVVNTILVDFRALDTFGELVVLAVAGLAMAALLSARGMVGGGEPHVVHTALDDPGQNAVFMQTLSRVVVPLMAGGSLYALWRGHDAPGGGFISALIGAAAVCMLYLAASSDRWTHRRLPFLAIAGSGVLLSAVVGLVGLVDGSYLRPIGLDLLGYKLSSALIFDLGVYLAVFGVILAAVSLLGGGSSPDEDSTGDPADETDTPLVPSGQEVGR
ncbi:DUF4040 family protein [Aeromicrobium sp. CTD01-1L150]|uniref:DUF4040 family protein n=1 Tax=Aeromicrobium sp. CTD01-1L150 TaxID=3341830 RepID=UPI0035C0B894